MVPVENTFTETRKEFYSETIRNVKRDSNFIVTVNGENSAGPSPFGYCMVDTTTIPTGRFGSAVLSLTVFCMLRNARFSKTR